ncbi:hypothetical protein B0H14DRAFT_3637630 [Mycena olivaceomarginata]|nr:hypothetical protein B0H14DRAFT_3637630 [Mycena olivaceomarginata]
MALNALIQLGRKYDCTNILATAVAHITHINSMTLNTYDDALLLINGVYKPTQITPHRGLSSDLAALACENSITAALPAAMARARPSLDLRCCLIGRERLLVKQFQPGYTLGWLRAWPQSPTCGDAAGCASPYSATSWTTASLRGCTSSTRQGVPDALRRVREGGCRGDGD